MINLDSILSSILTSGMGLKDLESIRKIKIFNVIQLAFIMLAPVAGLFYFYVGATALFYVTISSGLLMISCFLVLRKTKNLVLAANYAISIIWATLSTISWHTGAISYEGVINPSWILNAGLILLAVFLMGYLWGAIWTTIVFLEMGIVAYLYLSNYHFPNMIPLGMSATYHLGSFLVALLILLGLGFLFEKERNEALAREQGKSRALRESKKYAHDILEKSPVATFVVDRNHRVIQWNHACRKMSGIPATEILGKTVWEGFEVDERGSVADIMLDDPDSIKTQFGESIVSNTDGSRYELEIFLPKLREGKRVILSAAQIVDEEGFIRGAVQSVQEIKEQETPKGASGADQANMLGEAFFSPVYMIDSKGDITFWNRACEESFGYESSEMIGKNVLELLSRQYRPPFKDIIDKAFKGEPSASKVWKYVGGKGNAIYVLARMYPAPTREGGEEEWLILNTDITELRLKIKKLEVYAAESKEKLKNLGEEYGLVKKNIATLLRQKGGEK